MSVTSNEDLSEPEDREGSPQQMEQEIESCGVLRPDPSMHSLEIAHEPLPALLGQTTHVEPRSSHDRRTDASFDLSDVGGSVASALHVESEKTAQPLPAKTSLDNLVMSPENPDRCPESSVLKGCVADVEAPRGRSAFQCPEVTLEGSVGLPASTLLDFGVSLEPLECHVGVQPFPHTSSMLATRNVHMSKLPLLPGSQSESPSQAKWAPWFGASCPGCPDTRGYAPVRPNHLAANRWQPCPIRGSSVLVTPRQPACRGVASLPLPRPACCPPLFQGRSVASPLPRPVFSSLAYYPSRAVCRPGPCSAPVLMQASPKNNPAPPCRALINSVPLPKPKPKPCPKPRVRPLERGVVTHAAQHEQAWVQNFLIWGDLRELILPLSSVLQETSASERALELEHSLLRSVADTTAARYLSVCLAFFICAQESAVSLVPPSAIMVIDIIYSMGSDPNLRIHRGNALKALRWLCKTFLIELLLWTPLMKVLESSKDGLRREALPLPAGFFVFLERRVLDSSLAEHERIFAGALLACMMSSLRFSDAQHLSWSSISLAGHVLRATVYRTKTSRQGMPVGFVGSGLLGSPDHDDFSWVRAWLLLLGSVWDRFPSAVPDVLFFAYDEFSFQPLSYCQSLRRFRHLLHEFEPSCHQLSYSLHSLKTSALSAMTQLEESESNRRLQGHHRVTSAQLYGRDDVAGAVRAQGRLLSALSQGFLPVTPIGRGGQQPLPAARLDLTPIQPFAIPEHARFPYYLPHQLDPMPVSKPLSPVTRVDAPSSKPPSPTKLHCEIGADMDAVALDCSLEESDVSEAEVEAEVLPLRTLQDAIWLKLPSGVHHVAMKDVPDENGAPAQFRTACGCLVDVQCRVPCPPAGSRMCLRPGCQAMRAQLTL